MKKRSRARFGVVHATVPGDSFLVRGRACCVAGSHVLYAACVDRFAARFECSKTRRTMAGRIPASRPHRRTIRLAGRRHWIFVGGGLVKTDYREPVVRSARLAQL